jgi:hypothetical protein
MGEAALEQPANAAAAARAMRALVARLDCSIIIASFVRPQRASYRCRRGCLIMAKRNAPAFFPARVEIGDLRSTLRQSTQ